ncbi:MAG: FAD-dependent oxidoreductase [Rhodospirillales bacterium]|nr:FAD-dependent oxidoreductase [Rhodospirillales bacterium]
MTVHVIGAGLAGLAAAVRLSGNNHPVVVHEAAAHGGGRCRSFHDSTLKRRIDNGNHLLLSGNTQAMAYMRAIGSLESLFMPERAVFPFLDLQNAERWQVKPGLGLVPGSTLLDYLSALKLAWASENATVADVFDTTRPLFHKFWQPFSVSVLNTAPDEASARLLWPVLKQTLGRGAAACRPCIARQGLSESFIDPALVMLGLRGAQVRFNQRLASINFTGNRAGALSFADGEIVLGGDDTVILCVPAEHAAALVPDLRPPDKFRAIVNGHFLLPGIGKDISFLGLVGGVSQWLFVRGDVASVTVSAADALARESAEDIARTLWAEVAKALDLVDVPLGPYRIIKEKRATFAQSPEQVRLRADTRTRWDNVLLAGDWTQTGLPATIEGAITSGHRAAEAV